MSLTGSGPSIGLGYERMSDEALEYQFGFSDMHPRAMYDSQQHAQKANKTIAVISDYLSNIGADPANLSLLDIGCSTGYLSCIYGQYFSRVVGIDIDEPAVNFANENPRLESARTTEESQRRRTLGQRFLIYKHAESEVS